MILENRALTFVLQIMLGPLLAVGVVVLWDPRQTL